MLLFILTATLTSAVGLTSDLFLSTAQTTLLLASEGQLLNFLHRNLVMTAQHTGNSEYTRLAGQARRELETLPERQDARHPVDAYVGLKRFTHYWDTYISTMAPVVGSSVKESLAQSRLAFPDDEVLQLARQAIVRLQVAYHLNSTYLITTANANLTDYDVGSLAMVAQSAGFTAVAEDWKRLAATSVATDAASSDVGSQGSLPNGGSTPVRTSRSNAGAGETNTSHVKFYQVCRDFQNVEDAEMVLRSEGCAFTTGEIPFLRWKTEILSTSPYVVLYYDFVTEREATTVVNKAMDRLTWARTGADPDDFTLKLHKRLGKIAWLGDGSSPVLSRISQRVADVTGLYTHVRDTASFGEDFQVVNYGIGGHYTPHHDFFKKRNAFSRAAPYLQGSGDRAATFLIYLGSVSKGGATVFPSLGIGVPPVKNAALFWYNFTPDGDPDPRTLHGGCPVIIGEKWVANKWIHEISTAMTKTCGTIPWTASKT